MALRHLLHLKRTARPIGRNGEHGAEALLGGQSAQQPRQRRNVEAERSPIADITRQAPFYRAEARGAGEHHHRVLHP